MVRMLVTALDCVLLKKSNRALVAGLGPGPHTEDDVPAIEDLLPRRCLRKSFVILRCVIPVVLSINKRN